MSLKYFAFLSLIFFCVNAKKSITLVIDTTHSMWHELNVIKTNIAPIVHSVGDSSSVENYVVVPFNDPDVGPAHKFTNPTDVLQYISTLHSSGGNDIRENSLSGLEIGLRESQPESNVFLFTDACAKDDQKFGNIQRLCRLTRSKVIIIMSGNCAKNDPNLYGRIELYYDVAKVCYGNVLWFESAANMSNAFDFVQEIVKDDYKAVDIIERFTGRRQLPFTVDSFTKDVTIAVSGDSPVMQIREESGQSPHTQTLVDTRHSQVVRILNPQKGEYRSDIRCDGDTRVTIYKRQELPFQIGFSCMYPRTIQETSSKPIPGKDNYILIVLRRNGNIKLKTLIMHVLDDDVKRNLQLTEISGKYVSQAFFRAQKAFRLTVTGQEENAYEDFVLSTNVLDPQIAVTNADWSAAKVEIIRPESPLTDYEKNTTVACKVTGVPKPRIWWEDENGQQMLSEDSILEYPATYISHLSVASMTTNRTVFCKALTPHGEDSKSIELFVYRPYGFEMIQIPTDSTFEYESKGMLYCQVKAYPEAQVTWYHNGVILDIAENNTKGNTTKPNNGFFSSAFGFGVKSQPSTINNFEYAKEGEALVITKMATRFTGSYKCKVNNEIKTEEYTVSVNISGLEPPEVELDRAEITETLGSRVEMSCRVMRGTPKPVLTWKYKPVDGYEFKDIPEGVYVDGERLTVNAVKSEHKGSYQCEATNEQGQVSNDITLNVHYAPKIENSETVRLDVISYHSRAKVELKCPVDADPKATVVWYHEDAVLPYGDKYTIDDYNTLKFYASLDDSGTYRCVAENDAGTAEKSTIVNVLVPPYITPVSERIVVRTGGDVVLPCSVEYANPAPSLVWEFTAPGSNPTILFRGHGFCRRMYPNLLWLFCTVIEAIQFIPTSIACKVCQEDILAPTYALQSTEWALTG